MDRMVSPVLRETECIHPYGSSKYQHANETPRSAAAPSVRLPFRRVVVPELAVGIKVSRVRVDKRGP